MGPDLINLGAGGMVGIGAIAQRLLLNGFNINALRTNDILRKEEWLLLDQTVIDVARARLVGVADLLTAGLTLNLSNAFGTTVVQHQKVSDMTGAQVDMHGLTEGDRDRLEFTLENTPVPITHKEFTLNIRHLAMSRQSGGTPIDTTQAEVSARRVMDTLESMLFSGVTLKAGGGQIYGYTTFPQRNTGALTGAWTGLTGEQILVDVLEMIEAAVLDNMFGPFVMYVPVMYMIALLKDFKANSDKTILSRILEIPQISAIKETTQLTSSVVMVQMTRDVVDMVVGFQPTNLMWETHGGMVINVKVMSIMVPRIKADYDGRCGVVHFSA